MREINMDNVTYGKKMVNGKYEVDYEKWIDLSGLPKNGKLIDWSKSVGKVVEFKYTNIRDAIKIVEYNNNKLTIKYNNILFKMYTSGFSKVTLGNLLGKKTPNFKIEIGQVFKDDKRDLIILDRKYIKDKKGQNYKYYRYKCVKCGFECSKHYKYGELVCEKWIEESNLLQKGEGCSCCCSSPQITVPHINSIVAKEETHWMIPYFQGGYDEAKMYTPSSNQKVYFICPDCGEVKSISQSINQLYRYKSIGCTCSDGISYPNKFLRYFIYVLKGLYDLEFIFEYKVDNRFYDGYIKYKNVKYLIEMDGGFHGQKENSRSGRNEIENDTYKNKLAKKSGFKLIRIDCGESDMCLIKDNILKSELGSIFDLSEIDWSEIDKLSLKNIVKEVCEYWNNKKEWESTKDLTIVFNVSKFAIINYLKKGVQCNWCGYDPKEEMSKSGLRNGKASRRINIFKEEKLVGTFNSINELERKSEELFKINLNAKRISEVALGKKKHYKGFIFKYIEENQNIAS